MGTSYTTHVYWGAPVKEIGYDQEEPAWMRSDEDDDESSREAEDVIAEALGWNDTPYVGEDVDLEGHQSWIDNLHEKWRLNKEFDVELSWAGYLEWPERSYYINVTSSHRRGYDGESLNLSDLPAPAPEWEAKVRRCAEILELTLVEPLGWYATMSAG